jgi:demethylspheroidene O-methyltransferase
MSSKSNISNKRYALKTRWLMRRNRVFGSDTFHYWAARLPLFRQVTQRKAAQQMDMITGFVYSQILFVFVQTGLLEYVRQTPRQQQEILDFLDMPRDAALRIIRAGAALQVLESPEQELWLLGEMGATLAANPGAMAMIKHHQLLYRDLTNPVDIFTNARGKGNTLSAFWHYAAPSESDNNSKDDVPNDSKDANASGDDAKGGPYSELMAATQPMIWDQIIKGYPFGKHDKMLDIGGGSGAFVEAIGSHYPKLQLGIFDLPEVIPHSRKKLANSPLNARISLHPGSFKTDTLPKDYDLITLIRILHDHDDDVAQTILSKAFDALPKGGKLLIVEPMAETANAPRMGDAYFGLYLWAMGTGRPRPSKEYHQRLENAGFSKVHDLFTPLPIIAKAIVATK